MKKNWNVNFNNIKNNISLHVVTNDLEDTIDKVLVQHKNPSGNKAYANADNELNEAIADTNMDDVNIQVTENKRSDVDFDNGPIAWFTYPFDSKDRGTEE